MCDVNKASEDKQKKKDSSYSSFVFLSLSNCKHYNVRIFFEIAFLFFWLFWIFTEARKVEK